MCSRQCDHHRHRHCSHRFWLCVCVFVRVCDDGQWNNEAAAHFGATTPLWSQYVPFVSVRLTENEMRFFMQYIFQIFFSTFHVLMELCYGTFVFLFSVRWLSDGSIIIGQRSGRARNRKSSGGTKKKLYSLILAPEQLSTCRRVASMHLQYDGISYIIYILWLFLSWLLLFYVCMCVLWGKKPISFHYKTSTMSTIPSGHLLCASLSLSLFLWMLSLYTLFISG